MTRRELREHCKFKEQIAKQIERCAEKQDEGLSALILMHGDLAFQSFQARDVKYTLGTDYRFASFTGLQRSSEPYWIARCDNGLTDYQKEQNDHARKCLRQWNREIDFCLEKLEQTITAAIEADKHRLTVRLMKTKAEVLKVSDTREEWIEVNCENTMADKRSFREQREVLAFANKHGAVEIVPSQGLAHLFPTEEKALAFRKQTTEHTEYDEALELYESEGFKAVARVGEMALDDAEMWNEFREFQMSKKGKA
jgi:hypothetical protein